MVRRFIVASLVLFYAGAASADEIVAVKPGVMCKSAEALAKLTLLNGESRSHGPGSTDADRALAASGGCMDIVPGQRVSVVEAYRNTSVVMAGDNRMTIPNQDFAPVGSGSPVAAGAVPAAAGYRVAARIAADEAGTLFLVVMEDVRITPAVHKAMWGKPFDADFGPPEFAAFARRKALPAQVLLTDADGHLVAENTMEQPLAEISAAKLAGVVPAVYFLTVDYSCGLGSYCGPYTTLLQPAALRLEPVKFVAADGTPQVIALLRSLKRDWRVVPGRNGGTPEIEEIGSALNDKTQDFDTMLFTYRFRDAAWHMTSRTRPGFWEGESGFPPRREFP